MAALGVGTLIENRYRVVQLLGQGGFGAVYEAIDERLGHRIALKQLLHPEERISRQFEHEARLLANLSHPALPRVTDHFSDANGQFLVMEYIDGDDLANALLQNDAPFPLQQVRGWGLLLLDALQYLHTRQPPVIHRDIKPQNLKLRADGSIMLLDFGLAKGTVGDMAPTTTEKSFLAYTRGYAPPEQVEGTGTDARSDVYSLGGTLYCLLTNTSPPEAQIRLLAVARGRADPLQPAHVLNPAVPEAVSQVLLRALALEPDQRPASAQAMRELLVQAEKMPAPLASDVTELDTPVIPENTPPRVALPPPPQRSPSAAPAEMAQQPTKRKARWPLMVVVALILVALTAFVLRELGEQSTSTVETMSKLPQATAVTVEALFSPSANAAVVSSAPTALATALPAVLPSATDLPMIIPTQLPAPATALPTDLPTILPSATPARAPFPEDQFQQIVGAAGGTFGVVIYDNVEGKQIYSQNDHLTFPAASLIKLPIVLGVYDLAQQGQIDLNEQLTMRAEDITGGSGSLQKVQPGMTYTIRELCRRMLIESDNTAGNMILKRIGFAPVNALMGRVGANQTQVQRRFLDFAAAEAGRDNVTSPSDMWLLFDLLERGDVIGKAGAQELLGALQQNVERGKLPALLPPSVPVAHKDGTLTGTEHDAGIVYLPDRSYTIVVMSSSLPDSKGGIGAIAKASQLVYTWFAAEKTP